MIEIRWVVYENLCQKNLEYRVITPDTSTKWSEWKEVPFVNGSKLLDAQQCGVGQTMKPDCVYYDHCRKPVQSCNSKCKKYRDITLEELEREQASQHKEDVQNYMAAEYHF